MLLFITKYQIWKCSLNLYNYWKELMARRTFILLFFLFCFFLSKGRAVFTVLQINLQDFWEYWSNAGFPNFQPITMECCLVVMCILIGWNFGKSVLQCSPKLYRLAAYSTKLCKRPRLKWFLLDCNSYLFTPKVRFSGITVSELRKEPSKH